MNWITNYVRPRINSIFSRRETPENLWHKCDNCGTMLFHRELRDNLNVCTNCGHHMGITPRERFTALFDGGIFTEVDVPEPVTDPLQFRDQKRYPDRMKAAQKGTGEAEAMLVAAGEMGRTPRINKNAGRDHWPLVSSALLTGGGMPTGQVLGATNRYGEYSVDRPIHYQNVLATCYHHLGIFPGTKNIVGDFLANLTINRMVDEP